MTLLPSLGLLNMPTAQIQCISPKSTLHQGKTSPEYARDEYILVGGKYIPSTALCASNEYPLILLTGLDLAAGLPVKYR